MKNRAQRASREALEGKEHVSVEASRGIEASIFEVVLQGIGAISGEGSSEEADESAAGSSENEPKKKKERERAAELKEGALCVGSGVS
ncbi:uncharacterized protein J3R85_020370 [Psidium guajava]|nr:uncharacterized protein J3R85_020370 [Psidium guajava]